MSIDTPTLSLRNGYRLLAAAIAATVLTVTAQPDTAHAQSDGEMMSGPALVDVLREGGNVIYPSRLDRKRLRRSSARQGEDG